MKRDELIDCMKGIGILCVLLGHIVPYGSVACRFIFLFHMPLFFFLSGILYRESNNPWKDIKQTIVRYGVIYLLFNFIALIKLAILPRECWGFGMSYKERLWSVFVNGHPFHNGPLWFVVVLCVVWVLFRLFRNYFGERIVVLLFLGVVWAVLVNYLPFGFRCHVVPFMLTAVPLALLFFLSGFIGRDIFNIIKSLKMSVFAELTVVGALVFLLLAALPSIGQVNLTVGQIQSILAFPMALMGIVMVMFLSRLFLRFNIFRNSLSFVGRNSIAFFAMDYVVLPFIAYGLSHWIAPLAEYRPTMVIERKLVFLLFSLNLLLLALLCPLINWLLCNIRSKLSYITSGRS